MLFDKLGKKEDPECPVLRLATVILVVQSNSLSLIVFDESPTNSYNALFDTFVFPNEQNILSLNFE